MNSRTADPPLVIFSLRIYRSLLIVYPAPFRREYGAHILQLFRDCCLRAFRENSMGAIPRFWAITLFDLTRSALQQHLQKEAHMSRSQFIQVSGVAFMLSSLPYVIQNVTLGEWLIGSLLLALGVLGLRARYGASAGAFGRRILSAGVIGMLIMYALLAIGFVSVTFLRVPGLEGTSTFNPGGLWTLLYAGPVLPLLALALFGLSALRSKPMPYLNWLPLATGIWFPVLFGFIVPYMFTHDSFPNKYWNVIYLALLMQFFTLCVLGAVLLYDKLHEAAPA